MSISSNFQCLFLLFVRFAILLLLLLLLLIETHTHHPDI